ncbi:MAG: 30S ribosomal protein S5 [Candidatus Moraniibacteriota bacterium]
MSNKKFNGKKKQEFEQRLLDLARVARVMKGGRRFSFRATVVVGNRKGKVGLGTAKGSDVSDSIAKAFNKAKKNVILVKRLDSTISFRVDERFSGAKIMIKPAKEGKGIVAGGAMRSVIELAGVKNITAKSLGSPNKINVAKATLNALSRLEGKKVETGEGGSENKTAVNEAKSKAEKVKKTAKKSTESKAKKPEKAKAAKKSSETEKSKKTGKAASAKKTKPAVKKGSSKTTKEKNA